MPNREEQLATEALRAIECAFAGDRTRRWTVAEIAKTTGLPNDRINSTLEELARQNYVLSHNRGGEPVWVAKRRWFDTMPVASTIPSPQKTF